MEYILIFVVGFIGGWLALRSVVQYRMRRLRQLLEEAETNSKTTEIMVNFTRVGDQVYAYNADTEEFLVQGSTKDEIIGLLQKRWPNISFRASPANLKEVNLE